MDHVLILKYCNLVSVNLDSGTKPPVYTAHPGPLMLRALGLKSYLKLRALKRGLLFFESRSFTLYEFVFQDSLPVEFSIFALQPDLGAKFRGQVISLGVRRMHLLLQCLHLLLQCLHLLLQCLHFCLLQCANLLQKLRVAAVEVKWRWLLLAAKWWLLMLVAK